VNIKTRFGAFCRFGRERITWPRIAARPGRRHKLARPIADD